MQRKDVAHWPIAPAERRFVEEFLIDSDVEAAAYRAGLALDRAKRCLGEVRIQNALKRERLTRANRTQIYGDEIVRRYWQLATADARELTQVRYVNCRFCWGLDHRHQFRDHELAELRTKHLASMQALDEKDRVPFDDLGGGGFDGQRDPCRGPAWAEREIAAGGDPTAVLALITHDHSCPACDGVGVRSIWVADSRSLSPAAAALYDGVSVDKDGQVTVKTRNRDAALAQLGKHFGLFVQRSANLNLDPSQLTDEQLDAVLRQFGALAGADTEQGKLIEGMVAERDEGEPER